MQLVCGRGSLTSQQTDLIAVSSFAPAKPEEGPPILKRGDGGVEVDKALGGMLTDTLRRGAFRAEPGAFRLIPTCGKLPARYVLLLGAGREKGFTLETLRQQGAAIQKAAQQVKAATAAGVLQPERVQRLSPRDRARALVEGLSLGSYRFDRYKAKEDRAEPSLAVMTLLVGRERAAVEGAMREGQWLADAAIYVRDLVNLPGNVCTPQYLAEQARQVARHGKLQCTILDQKQILAQRMHLLIAVSQGAPNPPVFCHLRYTPPKKPTTHIALVGKGVTFDTGGLDLKTAKHMEHMKNDMAGAATVLAAMRVAALAKPSCLIDAFLPCTENVIDGKAHRPGDIVTARSGTTVELLNLDAEGRLILADALDYALEKKPDYLIDVATLTGGVLYALGEIYTAVLGNDQPLVNRLLAAGRRTGEPMWQLPLEQEYKKGFTSGPAQLRNIGKTSASTISGALFLQSFVRSARWAHLDIAASSWTDEERPYTPRGGTGVPARTLCEFLLGF